MYCRCQDYKCLVVWFTVHKVDRPRSWLLFNLIDQRLELDFVLPNSDSNLSEPHTSHCTLPLHIAHCTRKHTGAVHCRCQDCKCLVVWPTVPRSTVHVVGCLSLSSISNLEWNFVLPERKLFIAVSFWHNSDLLCLDRSRAGCSSSYRESYSRFPPRLQSWRIPKSALWNLRCIYVLPERKLFIALFHFRVILVL